MILYHSYPFTRLARRVKKFFERNIVIEVEEVYGYSALEDKPFIDDEIDAIKSMDKYIIVNDYIQTELGLPKDKCCVSYGVININQKIDKFDDEKTHVVYADTIERKKRGALTAVEASEFLPENYRMHVAGFGKKEIIAEL